MKSWKIGAIAGLIAGIVGGIISPFFFRMSTYMGLWESYERSGVFDGSVLEVLLPPSLIFGIILGVIYSRIYPVIPGKGISKGLCWSSILFLMTAIRSSTYELAYGNVLHVAGVIFGWFWFTFISAGLIIAIVYEILLNRYGYIEKLKIKTYDTISGILPGAIAGFCGGLAASVFAVMGHVTGYWGVPAPSGQIISTIDFWWSQAGTHTFINMMWGILFGAIFTKVFNLVPGKGVKKGLLYGLILFLITTFQYTVFGFFFNVYFKDWSGFLSGFLGLSIGAAQAIVFGLVIGYLYKPSK